MVFGIVFQSNNTIFLVVIDEFFRELQKIKVHTCEGLNQEL
jgi:hypothetical protein